MLMWRIARQTWTLWARDQRTRGAALTLVLLLVTCVAAGVSAQARLAREQASAAAGDERAWRAQDLSHPHDAAHFGRTVFRIYGPLAFLDPGVSPRVGLASRLEAHLRHPAHGRPADADTVLHRFPPVSVALVLQLVLPLVIMLAGFTAFAGEEARAVGRLELASGVSRGQLLAGRAIALGLPVAALLAVVGIAGGISLVTHSASAGDYLRLILFLVSHAALLVVAIGVTLLTSVRASSARHALVVLLALWMVGLWLVPRAAATVAEARYPVPSVAATRTAITEQTRRAPDRTDEASVRLAEELERLRQRYGVARDEDLPINLGGLSLEVGEEISSTIYNQAFAELFATYERQADSRRWWSFLSPLLPVAAVSAATAGTDLRAHEQFLADAESYRYGLVQTLNRHSRDFAGARGSAYVTDLSGIDVAPFTQTDVPWREVWRRNRWNLAISGLWCVGVVALLVGASRARGGVL